VLAAIGRGAPGIFLLCIYAWRSPVRGRSRIHALESSDPVRPRYVRSRWTVKHVCGTDRDAALPSCSRRPSRRVARHIGWVDATFGVFLS
jgi:hypothetical protein